MRVVYIAGPFSGKTSWDIECNVRRAEALALEVSRLSAMPMCPHTNTRHFAGEGTYDFWIAGTLELMRRCDAVLLTPDWVKSAGARGERLEALRLGIPVLETLAELATWLEAAAA